MSYIIKEHVHIREYNKHTILHLLASIKVCIDKFKNILQIKTAGKILENNIFTIIRHKLLSSGTDEVQTSKIPALL